MKLKLLIVLTACAVISGSCKKQEIKITPFASIKIINALVGGTDLQFDANVVIVPNSGYAAYCILPGSHMSNLTAKTLPNTMYYNQSQDYVNGGLYSFFLAGTPVAVESLFLKEENIPSHTADVFGARANNLVSGSEPISINVKGSANGSFVSSLAYKSISDFKDVSLVSAEGDTVFELRSISTGDLITSFTEPGYDMPRFRNITLVFVGASSTETVIRNNNC